jgi:hypothetical protein
MSSDPSDKDPPVEIVARPEPSSQAGTSVITVNAAPGEQPLMVPPDMLPKLTSDQVDKLIGVAGEKARMDHERQMSEIALRGKAEAGVQSAALLFLLGILVSLGYLLYAQQWPFAEKILLSLGSLTAGYFAGRGHERARQSAK